MVSRFVRKVRTASGAVAVFTRRGRQVEQVDFVESAHDDAEPALLLTVARERLFPGPDVLDLGDVPTVPARNGRPRRAAVGSASAVSVCPAQTSPSGMVLPNPNPTPAARPRARTRAVRGVRRLHFGQRAVQLAFESDYEAMLMVKARRDRLDNAIAVMAEHSEFTALTRRLA